MKKIASSLIAIFLISAPAMAGDDAGLGIELEGTFKIIKPLELGVVGEFRTQDGLGEADRFSLGIDLNYKPLKWLKADIGYLLLQRQTLEEQTTKYIYESYWSPSHRAFASVTGSWEPFKHFEFSLRERLQYTYKTLHYATRYQLANPEHRVTDKEVGGEGQLLLRSRLQCKWSRKKSNWSPYLSVEMLNDAQESLAIDQMRYTVGTDYKLGKHNSVGVNYRYKDKNNSDEQKGHLFTISYSYDF